jgi:hypothetical protein
LTLNHIVPLSKALPEMNPWLAFNIQVMCYLLNQIKGGYPDVQVVCWFGLWEGLQYAKIMIHFIKSFFIFIFILFFLHNKNKSLKPSSINH